MSNLASTVKRHSSHILDSSTSAKTNSLNQTEDIRTTRQTMTQLLEHALEM